MPIKKLFIKADNFYVEFITECEEAICFIKNKIDEFKRLTINFEVLDETNSVDIKFIYNDIEGYEIKFNNEKQEISFDTPWTKINASTVLPMMFRYIVEWLRQINGEIKVHASSVEKNGKTALFLAPSEGGKTTTAMAMCQKFGCNLKSNDAAVIKFEENLPIMLRGDTVFKVRFNGLQAYSKEIFNEKVSDANNSSTPWYEKMKINPQEMGVYSNESELPVKYLFFVKLDTMIQGCSIKKYNDNAYERKEHWFKPKMQILQNIGGTIRGSDLIPIGNDGTILPIEIPSIDTNELCINRIEFVNKLFETCEVYQLRGQLEDITEFINKTIT